MRKNDRDGIVELISSIDEAIDYCRSENNDTATTLLRDCEAAISSILSLLRTQLSEVILADYKMIIEDLENAVSILHNTAANTIQDEFYSFLQGNLSVLYHKLLQEEVQYEVVFLPYNVNMWDSLESIWMAAAEDPKCIPYVIPIPYFDKNRDGSLGQMHYDGELFPDYVPVTHYEEHNLANRNPEIIYFHNPYDKYNKVTSVHPMFYSDKLRKYTNMLVYVPYFMVMDYLSEDFAILPGLIYADKVIVQSEKIAEDYKKHYPGKDKDKILPLGSPKLDKVIRMSQLSREELNLPVEWKKRIGDKKVILYNTHLDHIMNRGDLFLKKLKYVFSCFENRDDAVLLWRPHPLSESTAAVMNPAILNDYRKLEKEFKDKEIGIFDDTPELHRSLALADAYYGDWSSLVPMFGATGKPVMIEDIGFYKEEDKKGIQSLPFGAIYIEEDEMWFSANEFNGLFHLNLTNGEVKHVACFPGEKMDQFCLYQKVVRYKNKLIWIPLYANEIAEYDLLSGEVKKVSIDISTITYKYSTSIIYREWLYLLPCGNVPCFKYNLSTGNMIKMDKWDDYIRKYTLHIDGQYSKFISAYLLKDKIYATLGLDSVILEINLVDESIISHKLSLSTGYSDIQFDGNCFWLLPRELSPVLQWNPITKKEKFFDTYDVGSNIDKIPFNTSICTGEDIWLFSRKSYQAIKVNRNDFRIKMTLDFELNNSIDTNVNECFSKVILKRNNEIILFAGNSMQILVIDINTNRYRTIQIHADEKLMNENLGRYIYASYNENQTLEKRIYLENRFIPLNHYIVDIVKHYDDLRFKKQNRGYMEYYGSVIYNRIKTLS